MRKILDNEDISNKYLLLEDSYNLIKDDYNFFESDEELVELLDTKINPDIKCKYVIECVNSNSIYKTKELLSRIYDLIDIYSIRIYDNNLIINDLLTLNKNYDSKVRIFVNNCNNKDFDISLALKNIGEDALLLAQKNNFIQINPLNQKMLEKLKSLNYIFDYIKRKEKSKKYLIKYKKE